MVAKAARRAQGKKQAGKRPRPDGEAQGGRGKKGKPDGKRKASEGGQQPPSKKQKTRAQNKLKSAAVKASGKTLDATVKAAEKAAAKTVAANPKVERKEKLKSAVGIWETLRRHDTSQAERDKLIRTIISEVQGRVVQVATSPKGSRVLQACAKFGTAEQRRQLLAELRPQLLDLARSPYAHFLVCRLIALAPKEDLPGLLAAFKGHVATLLRHPSGASVIDELYNAASAAQRNLLAAEFYGKEYALLTQDTAPASLQELLQASDAAKRRAVLQRMALHLLPISEKAIVDPALTHRLLAEFLQCAAPGARQEVVENLAGEPLLRMVHTREGALAAAVVLSFGGAKDCKKFVKAMKGHVETMAKDRWGSLVLTSALSHVDDTVLLRKIVLPPLREQAGELAQDKHARAPLLQLLAPDKPRYLPQELQSVVTPELASAPAAEPLAQATEAESGEGGEEQLAAAAVAVPAGQRKKDARQRRLELLGEGEGSLAAALLSAAAEGAGELLRSATGSDVVVELALGGTDGVLLEAHAEAVAALQSAIVAAVVASPPEGEGSLAEDVYMSRALRRLVLWPEEGSYAAEAAGKLAALLKPAFAEHPHLARGHGKKVADAMAKQK